MKGLKSSIKSLFILAVFLEVYFNSFPILYRVGKDEKNLCQAFTAACDPTGEIHHLGLSNQLLSPEKE